MLSLYVEMVGTEFLIVRIVFKGNAFNVLYGRNTVDISKRAGGHHAIKDNERSQKYSIPCKAPFHTGEPTGIDRLHHDMRCKGTQQQSDQEVGRAGIVPKQDKTQPETTYRCNQETDQALGYLECKGILRRLAFPPSI